jgi:hypothetical protein
MLPKSVPKLQACNKSDKAVLQTETPFQAATVFKLRPPVLALRYAGFE